MSFTPFLSKSKYLSGLQCSKLLWHYYNAKDHIPAPDAATQAIFDQGHLVGEYAKRLFPGGIEVAEGIIDFAKVIEQSQKLISERKPLFEAAFKHKNAYARVDILNPVGKSKWDIIEVKSSTEVKEINLHDLALQYYTYKGAGLDIRKCFLMCINNEYVKNGEVDPEELFAQEDVTAQVLELLPHVEKNLEEMVKVIARKKCPEITIGPHCSDPYGCPLQEKCWEFLPEHNLFTLNYFKKERAYALVDSGTLDILELDEDVKLSEKQKIQIECVRKNKPYVNPSGIQEFLETLDYPLYYLDFETFGTAIPIFDVSSPYQQIPFQFSLHIQDAKGKKPVHLGYLSEGKTDPRPELLALLKINLGTSGSIVTYNAGFEKGKLNKASELFTEYRKWNEIIQERIVDLLGPFRSFHYYHPSQMGSASIKKVLPALTGKGYEAMEIADGSTASNEYLRVTFGTDVSEQERKLVRKQLEEYCGLDTEGMVKIVARLYELSR